MWSRNLYHFIDVLAHCASQHESPQEEAQEQEQEPQARGSRDINPTLEISEFFNIVSESESYYDQFTTNAREIILKFKPENITGDVISDLHVCVDNLFTYITREYDPEDFIGITVR